MMKYRLLLLLACFSWQAFAQLTLVVTQIPANTPAGDQIYVAGSFQNWEPGNPNYILEKKVDGTYQITVNPPAGQIEYKFTRGSWSAVEGNANGTYLPNRTFNYNGTATTLELQILAWEDLGGTNTTAADNVHILDPGFFMPQLDRSRRVWIYLPPDYDTSGKHYPVMYMQDGQNVFDAYTSFAGEWEVDESLNQLFSQGDYGCIVVAIDNGGDKRLDEYAPWLNSQYNEGGEGDLYISFIVETLKPYIDSNYRTLPEPKFTALFGSSLGALISQYGLIAHQDVFSKAGIFSPAFWFNDPEIFDQAAAEPKLQDMKIYFLAGTTEGQGSVVADVNMMYSVLEGHGYGAEELKKVFHTDGQHSEWYWAREFPAAYLWLFGDTVFPSATEEATVEEIRAYPNPADSIVYVVNLPALKRLNWQISSTDGRLMKRGKLDSDSVDVSGIPQGAYILSIFSKKLPVFSQKLIIH